MKIKSVPPLSAVSKKSRKPSVNKDIASKNKSSKGSKKSKKMDDDC